MSPHLLVSRWIIRRTACVLLLGLTISTTIAWAQVPVPPAKPSTVLLIGYLVDFEDLSPPPSAVRASFEVLIPDAGPESYKLKVFDAGTSTTPANTPFLGETLITVDGLNSLPAQSVWVNVPPKPMKWEWVPISIGEMTLYDSLIFAIEMTVDQLRNADVVPFTESDQDDFRSYFSVDGGLTWALLTQEDLDCLAPSIICDDGSTYLRIHLNP